MGCEGSHDFLVMTFNCCYSFALNQFMNYTLYFQDTSDSETGKCECLTNYRQQADRTCVADDPAAQPRVGSAGSAEDSSSSVVAAVICILALVVLSVLSVMFVRYDFILTFSTLIFHFLFFRRYRLLPRLKARLTNTPYEDIVISEQNKASHRQTTAA